MAKYDDAATGVEKIRAAIEIQTAAYEAIGKIAENANIKIVTSGEGKDIFGIPVDANFGANFGQMIEAAGDVDGLIKKAKEIVGKKDEKTKKDSQKKGKDGEKQKRQGKKENKFITMCEKIGGVDKVVEILEETDSGIDDIMENIEGLIDISEIIEALKDAKKDSSLVQKLEEVIDIDKLIEKLVEKEKYEC